MGVFRSLRVGKAFYILDMVGRVSIYDLSIPEKNEFQIVKASRQHEGENSSSTCGLLYNAASGFL